MGRHWDGAGHGDPILILRVLRAAEHPTCCPPRTGVSALRDAQTSPTGHRIPFCDISPAAGMIFLAELSGSPRVAEGGGRGAASGRSGGRTSHRVQPSRGSAAVPEHAVLMTLFLFSGWGGKGGGSANNLTIFQIK